MHYNHIFSTLALLTLTAAAAVPAPKVLSLPFTRKLRSHTNTTISKRDDDLDVPIGNQESYYAVNIDIGTPAQTISVLLDTGSSDLWVDSSVFNPDSSSTYVGGGQQFQIGYGDGSGASGYYATDTISLGDATLSNGNFAFATQSNGDSGIHVFGIGFAAGEAAETSYANFPIQLAQQGITESTSYSLWLNDYDDASGTILFGGVDHAYHQGELSLLPILHINEGSDTSPLTRLAINLNSIGVSLNGNSGTIVSDAAVPVLLDSGTTYGLLPNDWVSAIAATLGATYDSQYGGYITTNLPAGGTLDLEFSGVTINTPFDAFIRPAYTNSGGIYQVNGQNAYTLGVQGSGDGVSLFDTVYILGDAFLAGAYVAFDLDNDVIAIANANLGDVSGSDIEVIGSNGIPGTSAPGYATATVSNTNYALHTPAGFSS